MEAIFAAPVIDLESGLELMEVSKMLSDDPGSSGMMLLALGGALTEAKTN